MSINFNRERWKIVKENTRKWWAGELNRPLINIVIDGCSPQRSKPKLSHVSRDRTSYDPAVAPEDIVDCWDYKLSGREFSGDSFPYVFPDFGPGVLAAFMGAKAEPGLDTVWFHPGQVDEAKNISFSVDLANIWLRRIKDICRIAMERWDGLVQVGMTDLGGNLDVVSTFLPGEKLLTGLIDCPDEIKRLTWEEHAMWWKAFTEIDAVLRPKNPGYTNWCPMFSETPYYMLQCDFSYMIGPEMFDEFVKPELEASCKKLDHAFYHLDGVGQLAHLDSLLAIKELKGVQWIPGTGKPQGEAWPDVYRKIFKAGKRAQFVGKWRNFDQLVDKIGTADGFIIIDEASFDERREVEAFLKRYGAM